MDGLAFDPSVWGQAAFLVVVVQPALPVVGIAFDLSAGQLLLNGEATLKGLVGNISSIGELLGGKSVGSQLRFAAPNVGGQLVLKLDPSNDPTGWSDYLNYDWNADGVIDDDDFPEATITFGLFRGNDKIIHWRELFD